MKNPFKYGSRVSGGAFFDREKIMRDMMGVLDGGTEDKGQMTKASGL